MNQIDAVIGDIKEMFAKQPNTIYEVRVVEQIPEIIKKIRKETGLTVRTNIYD